MGFLFNNETPTGINFNGNSVTELQFNGTTVWTAGPDYSSMYLTFVALEDGTFSFKRFGTTADVYYSIDDGTTWTVLASDTQTPTVTTGNKILWKSDRTSDTFSYDKYNRFSSTGQFDAEGNVMSMVYGDNFEGQTSLANKEFSLVYLFRICNTITNAENLILPATTLAEHCYQSMFDSCTSLTTAPKLPATTLGIYCYQSMFQGCTSLTTAPALPATTLVEGCYNNMFYDCTSLTTAPALPATTLGISCYDSMLHGCTSLTTAPELPATTLAENCYSGMFYSCTNLATAPNLPATTLASQCYQGMFGDCTSLTTAPNLPATTLVTGCYRNMFNSCTNLNYIKMLATDISATGCLTTWVSRVSATGTFVKNTAATWDVTGNSGIPTGWTIEYDVIELQYVQHDSTHKGIIDLGVVPTINTRIQFKVYFSGPDGGSMIGQQSDSISLPDNRDYRLFTYSGTGTNLFYWDLQDSRIISNTAAASNTWYELEIGNNYIKNLATDETLATGTPVTSIYYDTISIWLFSRTSNITCRFGYVKTYEDQTLTHNFSPILKDGVYGMYDSVNGTYVYGNGDLTGA